MTTHWRPYTPGTYEHPSPGTNADIVDVDVASVWTAHLPLTHTSALPTALDALDALGRCAGLTGEYLHEASYHQWGEKPDPAMDTHPDHLALYFRAPTPTSALQVAEMLLRALAPLGVLGVLAHGRHEIVLTHADDWDWDHTTTMPTSLPMPAVPASAVVDRPAEAPPR